MNHEKVIAEAAATLLSAIEAAEAAGYRVGFPKQHLASIPISETARVAPPAEPEAPPVPVIGRRPDKAMDPAA